jgi:nucleotide-binding universal stress UspA family protein
VEHYPWLRLYISYEIVPSVGELWCRPEAAVELGEPAERILEAAKERGTDLIVLVIRSTGHLLTATHLATSTARRLPGRGQFATLR